jgi:hypothetical protein
VVSAPSGVDICLKDCSGIGFVAVNGTTTAAILTVVAKPSFGGSSKIWNPANGFGLPSTVYTRTANTAAWVANAVAAGGAWNTSTGALTIPLTTTGLISYVDFLVSQLADTYDYINVTVSGTGATLPVAILYDLNVQRTPENLRKPSA